MDVLLWRREKNPITFFFSSSLLFEWVLTTSDMKMFSFRHSHFESQTKIYDLPLINNDDESFSWNRSFIRVLGLVVTLLSCCSFCWVVIASNAVVFPSSKPWRGSMVGKEWFTLADGDNVCVVLLIFVVKPSWPASKERVVSPLARLVTFVNELFGVRRSSISYLGEKQIVRFFCLEVILTPTVVMPSDHWQWKE